MASRRAAKCRIALEFRILYRSACHKLVDGVTGSRQVVWQVVWGGAAGGECFPRTSLLRQIRKILLWAVVLVKRGAEHLALAIGC